MTHVTAQHNFAASMLELVPPCRPGMAFPIPAACVCVSIGNPNFNGRRLDALIEWVQSHADRCALVVGGELWRWTLMIERGLDEAAARAAAVRHERRQIKDLRRALSALAVSRAFTIIRDIDLRQHPRFVSARQELDSLYSRNSRFADLLTTSAQNYCEARLRRGRPMHVALGRAIDYSARFILEELAIYCTLVADGWPVEIYPGPELPVLREIAAGGISDAPKELRARTNVVLDVSPISFEEAA